MNVGEGLKYWREKQGKTQLQVAEKLGVGVPFVSAYENNRREPKISTLRRFADALDISIYDLLSSIKYTVHSAEEFEEYTAALYEDDIDMKSIKKSFQILNPDGQEEAARYTESLTHIEKYTK